MCLSSNSFNNKQAHRETVAAETIWPAWHPHRNPPSQDRRIFIASKFLLHKPDLRLRSEFVTSLLCLRWQTSETFLKFMAESWSLESISPIYDDINLLSFTYTAVYVFLYTVYGEYPREIFTWVQDSPVFQSSSPVGFTSHL